MESLNKKREKLFDIAFDMYYKGYDIKYIKKETGLSSGSIYNMFSKCGMRPKYK